MKKFFFHLLLILATGSFLPNTMHAQNLDSKKNVVVVLVDDLGWTDVGYAGSALYKTPHLDELASKATVFTQAYSAHPVCSPSRAAIMTGKNPTRLGITDWIPGSAPKDKPLLGPKIRNELPLQEKTIAEYFKEVGYHTFFAGKWHLGGESHGPEHQGFDINIGGIHKGQPPNGYYAPYKNPKLTDGPKGEYLTDRLTEETIGFIRKNKNERFFAFLSYYTVHTPIQASKEDRPDYDSLTIPDVTYPEHDGVSLLYQNNLDYASMVSAMDRNVGKLIQSLKEMGLWENTVFLFTSDNGGLSTLIRDWKIPTSNRPLRAGKGWAYEGGIRIPQIIHRPDQPRMISHTDVPTTHQDLLPLLWSAAGWDPSSLDAMDGYDIFGGIQGTQRLLFWDYPHYHGSGWKPGAALRQGRWKLIHFYESGVVELYDLHSDPGESINVRAKHPDIAAAMFSDLKSLIKSNHGQFPKLNPNYAE
ncbi:sulfatase [Membranicola marinus]|uniref:Sulfatase n=1 Tax=Membranihabitans marinus TaxID=1227546 RepID=A0A953I007_9BACT|nr:sulfatase [Membranihabitans marinus]MBY5958802.1 sulfatase [Membranihabitans marinus]